MSVKEIADAAAVAFISSRPINTGGGPGPILSPPYTWEGAGFQATDHKIVDFSYPTPLPQTMIKPKMLNSLTWSNDTSSTEDYQEFDLSDTYASSFTWSVTEGIKLSTSETIQVGVPEMGSASETVSFELNISSTQSQTTTKTTSFGGKSHIQIPPYSTLTASLVISEGTLVCPWTANVQVTLGECGQLTASGGWIKFDVSKQPGWEKGSVQKFPIKGTFSGVHGYDAQVTTDTKPIPHH